MRSRLCGLRISWWLDIKGCMDGYGRKWGIRACVFLSFFFFFLLILVDLDRCLFPWYDIDQR